MSLGVPLDFPIRTRTGEVVSGAKLYILQRGDPDRAPDLSGYATDAERLTAADAWVAANATEVQVYSDPQLTQELSQPLTTGTESMTEAYVAEDSVDRYAPQDAVQPIRPWESVSGHHFRDEGFHVGSGRRDGPLHPGEISIGRLPEPGGDSGVRHMTARPSFYMTPSTPEMGEAASRAILPAALRVTEVIDPFEIRGVRTSGINHVYRTGVQAHWKRRYPAGYSTTVAANFGTADTEIWLTHARQFPLAVQDEVSGVTFECDGVPLTFTGRESVSMTIAGHHPIGSTEVVLNGAIDNDVPETASAFQSPGTTVSWDGIERALEGTVDGDHLAGADELVVSAPNADLVALPDLGQMRVIAYPNNPVNVRWASKDIVGDSCTFELDEGTRLPKVVEDGAAVTVDRILNVKGEFETWAEGQTLDGEWFGYEEGATVIHLALDSDNDDMMDRWAVVPSSGWVRIEAEVRNPAGFGDVDRPTLRVQYTSKNEAEGTLTLAAPFPERIEHMAWCQVEDVPGLCRAAGNAGQGKGGNLVIHKLTGVVQTTPGTGAQNGVAEFNPRYRAWAKSGSVGFFAGDAGTAAGATGWLAHWGITSVADTPQNTDAIGELRAVVVRYGDRIQTMFMRAGYGGIYGSRMNSVPSDANYKWTVGSLTTRIRPPNLSLDDPEVEDPEEPDGGFFITTGELFVNSVEHGKWPDATFYPDSRKLEVTVYNNAAWAQETRIFGYVDHEPVPQDEAKTIGKFTTVTFSQSENGPKTTLNGSHALGSITAINLTSGTDWADTRGKWRMRDGAAGSVLAEGTYVGRTGNTLNNVTVTSGSGTIPDDTFIEEDYDLEDFWFQNGLTVALSPTVPYPASASVHGLLARAGEDDEILIDAIGPDGEVGVDLAGVPVYKDSDDDLSLDGEKLATQTYADLLAQGVKWKATCRAATTANITLSNVQTIDGVSVVAGDRVLVKNQSTQSQNGIYVCVAGGAWTRATDADTGTELEAAVVAVAEGTAAGNTTWRQTTTPVTLGSSNIVWTELAGITSAGAGLTRTGNTVDAVGVAPIQVNADSIQLTAAPPPPVDRQVFTADGTWTKPTAPSGYAAYSEVEVEMIGGGGGGGGGRCGNTGTDRRGGGGGAGGQYSRRSIDIDDCAATEPVDVGAAGAGGAGGVSGGGNGATGTSGGNSLFGTSATIPRTRANGGPSGAGGQAGAGGAGGAATAQSGLVAGQAGGASQTAPTAIVGWTRGGGGGGNVSTGDVAANGAAGGDGAINQSVAGAAGTAPGGAGGNGSGGGGSSIGSGGGGGGGGGATAAVGGDGGDGGAYGSGGGGGGASQTGNAAGAGGDGAPGIIVVTTR